MFKLKVRYDDLPPGTIVIPAFPEVQSTQYEGKVNRYKVAGTQRLIEVANTDLEDA